MVHMLSQKLSTVYNTSEHVIADRFITGYDNEIQSNIFVNSLV